MSSNPSPPPNRGGEDLRPTSLYSSADSTVQGAQPRPMMLAQPHLPGHPQPYPQQHPSSGAPPTSQPQYYYPGHPPQQMSQAPPPNSTIVGTFVPPGHGSPHGPVTYAPIPLATSQPVSAPFPPQPQYVPYNPRIPPSATAPPPQNAYAIPPQQYYYQQQQQQPPIRPWSDSGSDVSEAPLPGQQQQHQQQPLVQQQQGQSQTSLGRRSPFPSLKRTMSRHPNIPKRSYALDENIAERTNKGNTAAVMSLLADMWFVHIVCILALVYLQTFVLAFGYDDVEVWNFSCYYKLGWLLPTPYTIVCFFGLVMPYRTPRFLYHDKLPKRRCDNLYILTVTRGNNREAVYRSWNAHRHLERIHPSVRVHVLTDEPFFFENINCYTCPKAFSTSKSKYKARALEWYRQTMAYTEHDWVLHLDEESVIDDESVRRVLEFIWYETDMHMGQGPIFYNQYRFWKNWFFTVADALRVGDDLSRFHLQLTYFKRPVWGCHGSFLLVNGLVENAITWDLGSLTEDYEFAMAAWARGFKVGKVPGIIREQSPQGLLDFMKQRRRWFVGIWRLRHPLPKIWALFWTLGSLCLFTTIATIPIGFFVRLGVPRWFGFLKDVTSSTFIYLYVLGIFVQDLDKGKNPILVLIHIPISFVFAFISSVLETISVLYGVFFPPKDFDVIKK